MAPITIVAMVTAFFFFDNDAEVAEGAWYNSSWQYRIGLTVNSDKVVGSTTPGRIYLTSGTSWTVPNDWDNSNNSIEVIGGGGAGAGNGSGVGGGGGGGGAYAKVSNVTLTPGSTVTYAIGAPGVVGTSPGGDTYFCNSTSDCASISGGSVVVGAKGGGSATDAGGGAGGLASTSVGTIKNSGGTGGNAAANAGAGGGGAGGPYGPGANGASGSSNGGGGGGGGGGGYAGAASASGGAGGNNYKNQGGGATAGQLGQEGGGGAGGASGATGGYGGQGSEWDGAHGSGGGGGGSGHDYTGAAKTGGLYGGGGGSKGNDTNGSSAAGSQGIVVITYNANPAASTQVDFPVYVDLSDLPNHVWSNMKSDCGDIRITAANGSTEVPREIVYCDSVSKTGELHFKAPVISAATDTVFYIYYGNSSASDYAISATYGAENVWTNGYGAVWHFPNGSSLSLLDSTSNSRDATNVASSPAVSGKIDGAVSFNGSSQYLTFTSPSLANSSLTVEGWVYLDNVSTASTMISIGSSATANNALHLRFESGGRLRFAFYSNDIDTRTFSAAGWYHVAATYDFAARTRTVYMNGMAIGGDVDVAPFVGNTSGFIGRDSFSASSYMSGDEDEMRLSTVSRSSGWIMTEYNNHSDPDNFYTIGKNGSGTGLQTVYLTEGSSWTVPIDWNSASNTIEVIGGGGGGAGNNGITNGGGGGGGGAYSKISNLSLTPGASVTYAVGAGGGTGSSGGDTWFNASSFSNCVSAGSSSCVGAKGGTGGVVTAAGSGGATGSGVGIVKYAGGNGGTGGSNTGGGSGGGGGGGAAGPHGAGANGGNGSGTGSGIGGGGGGGGGANGGSAGTNNSSTGGSGVAGGNGRGGTGGGAASGDATDGTGGGGGGSQSNTGGGAGAVDFIWDNQYGPGGGGGGGGGGVSTAGGRGGIPGGYGGGGGGGGYARNTTDGNGAEGAQGVIVIQYDPIGFNYNTRVFTSSGVFAVPPGITSVEVLVVGGGGGGGADFGGGGGAGGVRYSANYSVTPGSTVAVTVGGGGGGAIQSGVAGNGEDSSFGSLVAAGGGGGSNGSGDSAFSMAKDGGSGGGGGGLNYTAAADIGLGNTPSTTPSQGSNGGLGYYVGSTNSGGGGGGGAGEVGQNGAVNQAGRGGNGASYSISGLSVVYGGGGGGGGYTTGGSSGGAGGEGGGGAGGSAASENGADGTANTGGGGGGNAGGGRGIGGNGGSGIVIVRYSSVPATPSFSVAPFGLSTTSISMTATTTDWGENIELESGSFLEYYFSYVPCSSNAGTGGSDSGWLSTSTYTDTGLQQGKCYGYKTRVRDALGNISSSSATSTATTVLSYPYPPTFSTAPFNASSTAITMVATTTDRGDNPGGTLEYYFTFVACGSNGGTGGTDSGWISTSTYTDTGLQPNKCYGYKVLARDGGGNVSTSSSATSSTYTSAATPGAPIIESQLIFSETLDIFNSENGNPVSNPATLFVLQISSTTPLDSNWNGNYLDASGNPTSTPVWLSDTVWDSIYMQSVLEGTTYQMRSKARNQDGDETPFGPVGTSSTPVARSVNVEIRGGTRLQGGVRLQ